MDGHRFVLWIVGYWLGQRAQFHSLDQNDGRSNAVLSDTAVLSFSVNGGDIKTIEVASSTAHATTYRTIRDLVKEVDEAIATAYGKVRGSNGQFSEEDLAGLPVRARASGDRLALIQTSSLNTQASALVITYANEVAQKRITPQSRINFGDRLCRLQWTAKFAAARR